MREFDEQIPEDNHWIDTHTLLILAYIFLIFYFGVHKINEKYSSIIGLLNKLASQHLCLSNQTEPCSVST
jgi:hypothetical protein